MNKPRWPRSSLICSGFASSQRIIESSSIWDTSIVMRVGNDCVVKHTMPAILKIYRIFCASCIILVITYLLSVSTIFPTPSSIPATIPQLSLLALFLMCWHFWRWRGWGRRGSWGAVYARYRKNGDESRDFPWFSMILTASLLNKSVTWVTLSQWGSNPFQKSYLPLPPCLFQEFRPPPSKHLSCLEMN